MTVTVPQGYVLGDGTTGAVRAKARWRQWRWPIGVAALSLVVLMLATFITPQATSTSLSPSNPGPSGARAVAQVLGDRGVKVIEVATLSDAGRQLRPGDTLVITAPRGLSYAQVDSVVEHEGRIVVWDAGYSTVEGIDAGLTLRTDYEPDVIAADCEVPEAVNAGAITSDASTGIVVLLPAADSTVLCFLGTSNIYYALHAVVQNGDYDIHLFTDSAMITNARVLEEGNAALALNVMGTAPRLIWYAPDDYDESTLTASAPGDETEVLARVPSWMSTLMTVLLLLGVVGVLWRGRRMGPLVEESLPVVVRASEATRGRARLYRRANARGHASASLRAAAAARMAKRLGLPRTADSASLIAAVSLASGKPSTYVESLLYGPPPTSNPTMLDLVHQLDALESEVHRP